MVTKKTIDSPQIRQLSRRGCVSGIVIGAELKVGMGGGAAFFIDMGGSWRGVMAREEACS